MKVLRPGIAALFFSWFFLSSAVADDGVHIAYSERLQQLSMQYPPSSAVRKPGTSELQSIRFDAFGKRFDINLKPNHTLLSAVQRRAVASQIEVYRGELAGLQNSWARLVVSDGIPRGMIWDGEYMYAVDVIDHAKNGAGEAAIFRLDDMQIAPDLMSCSAVSAPKNAGGFFKAIVNEVSSAVAQGVGATSQIDIAVLGDFEFTNAKGASAQADIIARMNNVDGIFSMQLGVQLNVNRIDTYTANDDPFSDETEAGALVDELADFRNVTATQNANGLTHLFTGRDLDGTTVGIAYGGALCSRRFGAGLTQGDHDITLDSLIAAHEIGHNFGAPHDGTAGSSCESEAQDFLMAPRLNGSDTFSSCSITQMQDDVAAASCISALPSTDAAIASSGQPAPALLGDSATIGFAVNSVGTNSASNVNVGVTIPSAVTLSTVSASVGSCTSGAGSVSCSLGSIAAGSGVDVTIVVSTNTAGNADFVASITADTDANSNNNQATVQLTVNDAVDLVSTAAAAAQVTLNQSMTIRPTVENRSSLVATGVAVTVTPSGGIRVDSATWAAGSCSVTAGVATCQASALGAQSNSTLDIQLTGTSEGNQSYTVSATAVEADRDTSNNNASGQVNVQSAPTNPDPGGDSGGGSLSLMMLLLLALALVRQFVQSNESRATKLSTCRASS